MKTMHKTVLIALATVFTSLAHAEVSTRYQVVAVDDAPETKLCMVAAAEGFEAARQYAQKTGFDLDKSSHEVLCNGKSVYRFSKRYSDKDVTVGLASVGSN